jgi:biopolymer transport protein ExbB
MYLFFQLNELSDGEVEVTSIEDVIQSEETLSIMELIINAGWYIMIPLAILGFIALYITIERYFAIKKANKIDKDFMDRIKDYVLDNKIDSAIDYCSNQSTPLARMLQKGIGKIGKPIKEISASIENIGKLEVYKMEKGLSTLATIAGVAPMIGFLGTVIGMIITFHAMKISGNGVEIGDLSGGIMQAMVTTVAGLVIGIVAYISYNFLVTKVDKVVHNMEVASVEFLDLLDEPGN